jgi:hypothetical protein
MQMAEEPLATERVKSIMSSIFDEEKGEVSVV